MNINYVTYADFCEDRTTVEIRASAGDCEEVFYVQTVDGVFRSDLGCWVLSTTSDGDISYDDYPLFDFDEIISAAEEFMQAQVEEERTDFIINNKRVYLIIKNDNVDVVTKNENYINPQTSSYQREFSEPLESFTDRDAALNYLNNCLN